MKLSSKQISSIVNRAYKMELDTLTPVAIVWLRIAREAAQLSKDPKAKIAALAIRDNRIVSIGVNGYPSGYDDTDFSNKHDKVIHAEINAILNYGGSPLNIDTLVIYGLPPCIECIKHMAAINIERVFFCENRSIRSWLEWRKQFDEKHILHKQIKFTRIEETEL